MTHMKTYIKLFSEFFWLGLLTFGGGIAMLPVIKATAIKHGWLETKDWEEVVTLSQLAPGAIAINCANLIGYRAQGKRGSVMAVFGMMLAPILVITGLALGLQTWLTNPLVLNALKGMFLVVMVLFLNALIGLGKIAWPTWWMVGFSGASFLLIYFQILSPVWLIAMSFILLWLWSMMRISPR